MTIRLPLRSSLHARVGDKRLSGTHRSSSVAECCVKQPTASRVDEKIIYVVQGQVGKFSLQLALVVLDTLQNKADNKTFYGIENIASNLILESAMETSITQWLPEVSANAPMLCLLKSVCNRHSKICLRVMSREEISSSPSIGIISKFMLSGALPYRQINRTFDIRSLSDNIRSKLI